MSLRSPPTGDSPSTDVALSVATKPKKNLMYETILVTLDGTPSDRAIIEHIKQLAKLAHSRLVLLHVADGWAARTYAPDAVRPEIAEDTAYLGKVRAEFESARIPAH